MLASRDEFLKLQASLATTVEGGAAAFLLALFLRRTDETLGATCLAETVFSSCLWVGNPGAELVRRALQRIDKQLHANPGLPQMPWTVTLTTNPYSGDADQGLIKLFVVCAGANSPRPVTLERQEDGLWKASEWSSLLMGIRRPEQAEQQASRLREAERTFGGYPCAARVAFGRGRGLVNDDEVAIAQ